MGENEIIDMLCEIRSKVISTGNRECMNIIDLIDWYMSQYRGLTNEEIAYKLNKNPLIFEIGKCYQHTTGRKMRIIGEMDTYYYGHCLIGETDTGEYIPVGREAENAVNWIECEDFAKEEK